MEQNVSPLQHYQQIRERLYGLCEDAAKFANATQLDVIDDPHLESWVVLHANEIVSASYRRQPLAQLITTCAERLREPFRLAVMGEFSRGKSTFINALLGRELLAANWRPNTAVRTTIRAGTPQRIRVQYLSGQKPDVKETDDIIHELASLTSDAEDEDNQDALLRGTRLSLAQKYKEVEVFADIPFLRERELELIDTPGLGSVFDSHQGVAYSVLTEAEMIIYTIQFTPGIEATDIDFLRSVGGYKDRFLFLLTKRNHAKSTTEVQDIINLVETSLRVKVGIEQPKIYPVEAAFALNGRANESGMAEVLHGIESELVAIAGGPRIQETLRFLTTCNYWFSQRLSYKALSLKQTMQLQSQRREMLTFRINQALQLQNVMHDYTRNSFMALLSELKTSINELPHWFQFASETVIDRLGPYTFAQPGPQVVSALQTELQRWLQEKAKYVQIYETGVIGHVRQIMTALFPPSSDESVNAHQHSFPVVLNSPALQSLFVVVIPGIVDLTAKLGMSIALKSVHARYRHHLLAPVAQQQLSFYQIVLDGINIPQSPSSTQIAIKGIRRDLEQTFVQVCKSLETCCGQIIDAHIRFCLAYLEQEQKNIDKEASINKKAFDTIELEIERFNNIKRNLLEIELESKNISSMHR